MGNGRIIPNMYKLHVLFFALSFSMTVGAADWPQFRFGANRGAATPEVFPTKLHLQWSREFATPSPIPGRGAAVCDLEKFKKLTLSYSKISNEGFSDLKEAAKLKQLKVLGLLNTRITDVGLNELTKLQQLGFVNLRSTKVTMGSDNGWSG